MAGLAILVVVGLVAALVFQGWLLRAPERGVQVAFLTSGILVTAHLPVVRDKFTATELVFLLTWFALLLRRGQVSLAAPFTEQQKVSLLLGGIFVAWVFVSFAVNNIVYVGGLAASLLETVNFLYGYLMFATVVVYGRTWPLWRSALHWWVGGAVVVVFFAVWAMIGGAPGWTTEEVTGRVSSTLRNENQLPSYLLPIFVPMVFMAVRKGGGGWRAALLWLLIAGSVMASIGTGSRTALLMLLVSAGGVFYIATRRYGERPYRSGALAVASLALVLGIVGYIALALLFYDGSYSLIDTPAWQRPVVMLYEWLSGNMSLDSTRPEQIARVFEELGRHPILGTGPKIYGGLYGMAEIHNTYAGILMQTGLIGFALFMLWLGHLLYCTSRAARRVRDPYQKVLVLSLLVGMATLLLYNMTMFGLRQRTIWLAAGLLVGAWSLAVNRRYGPADVEDSDSEALNRAAGASG